MIPADYIFSGRKLRIAREKAGLSLWRASIFLARHKVRRSDEAIRQWELSTSGRQPPARAFFLLMRLYDQPAEFFFVPPRRRIAG